MTKTVYMKDAETGELRQVDLEDLLKAHFTNLDPGSGKSILDAAGHEIPNPVPFAPAIGAKDQPSMFDQMRQLIRAASEEAKREGYETLEESEDFGDDEDFPRSPHELPDDHVPVSELKRRHGLMEAAIRQKEADEGQGRPEGGEASLDAREPTQQSKKAARKPSRGDPKPSFLSEEQ